MRGALAAIVPRFGRPGQSTMRPTAEPGRVVLPPLVALPDLNLLPPAYLTPRVLPRQIALWLLIVIVPALLTPVALTLPEQMMALERTHEAIARIEIQIEAARSLGGQIRQRRATLTTVEAERRRLDVALAAVCRQQVAWAPLLAVARDQAGAEATLLALHGSPGRLEIDGHAASTEVVLAYAERLRTSGAFANAIVASIGATEAPAGRRAFRLVATPA